MFTPGGHNFSSLAERVMCGAMPSMSSLWEAVEVLRDVMSLVPIRMESVPFVFKHKQYKNKFSVRKPTQHKIMQRKQEKSPPSFLPLFLLLLPEVTSVCVLGEADVHQPVSLCLSYSVHMEGHVYCCVQHCFWYWPRCFLISAFVLLCMP